MPRLYFHILFLSISIFLTGCEGQNKGLSSETEPRATGGISLQFDFNNLLKKPGSIYKAAALSPSPLITAASATVSRVGYAPIVAELSIKNNVASGQIESLAPGQWHIEIGVYSGGRSVYTGSSDVSVIAGPVTHCAILPDPVPADAQIIVPSGFKAVAFVTGLNQPSGIAVAPSGFGNFGGHLFIANVGVFNGSDSDFISRVSPDGSRYDFANVGTSDPNAISFGPGGAFGENLFVATNTTTPGIGDSKILEIDSNGTTSSFAATCCSGSGGIGFDLTGTFAGNMYVGLTGLDGIGKVSPSRSFSIFSSFPGAVGGGPVAIKFGPGGNFGAEMFISISSYSPAITLPGVYKISPNGTVSTVVNTSSSALIGQPGDLAFSPAGIFGGDLYLTDRVNGTVLRITPQGSTTVFARGLSNPHGIAFSGTDVLYVVERDMNRVIKITASAISATIDVKPGSFSNNINPKNSGVIPVAILTTAAFDATTVDPSSVKFGPNGATECHGMGHIEDVDGDGDQDMIVHFRTEKTGIQCADTVVNLIGKTISGQDIAGADTLQTVDCK